MTLPGRLDWLVWQGSEVEGRLLGVPSLFVGQCPDPRDLPRIDQIIRPAAHVLFGPRFLAAVGFGLPEECLRRGQLVTLELDSGQLAEVPVLLGAGAHLMVRLPVPELGSLKPDDTVKLNLPDPGQVACAAWRHFTRTRPSAYRDDHPLLTTDPGR